MKPWMRKNILARAWGGYAVCFWRHMVRICLPPSLSPSLKWPAYGYYQIPIHL